MNFCLGGSTTNPDVRKFDNNYHKNCRYQQLKASLPHFVFMNFGLFDTNLKNFTEKNFIEWYGSMIKEIQALPTKPTVFLMSPVWSVKFRDKDWDPKTWQPNDQWLLKISERTDEAMNSFPKVIYKIAEQNGIPHEHVLDTWNLLRNPDGTAKSPTGFIDGQHLNP